ASEIRKLDRADARSVLIYACTANMFQEDKEQAMASGMDDFLTKPIDVDVLLKKLRRREKS
ncbi:MAG: hybrid sensor histidine kinase/response regulator, partial [Roseburia sp.]|nr:hybrid sensor histidine kinase/response regulator [Roseburia sp.]